MYTNIFLKQILHAYSKNLVAKNVCELGKNSWHPNLNKILKANVSHLTVSETPQEFFKQMGSKLTQYQRTPPPNQNTVIAKDVFENSIDIIPAFKQLHDLTATNGVMIMNCPIGVTSHVGSISVMGLINIANKNDYGVSYLAIGNEHGDCIEKINTAQIYSTTKLKELLYKFRETIDLRISATFVKTSDKEFQI